MRAYKLCKKGTPITGKFYGLKTLVDTFITLHETVDEDMSLSNLSLEGNIEIECEFTSISIQSGGLICFTEPKK